DLTWGRALVELSVQSTIDLTLNDQTAAARHRLVFPASASARLVTLRAAAGMILQLRAIEGDVKPGRDGEWILNLPPSPGREQVAVLSYTSKLATKPDRMVEPGLVWPTVATRCDTRVRIWGKPAAKSARPALVEGPWE